MKTPLSSDDQRLLCTVMVLSNVLNETTIVLKAANCKKQRRILCQSQNSGMYYFFLTQLVGHSFYFYN